MKGKTNDFDKVSQVFQQFSEKNKENLVKTAKNLLAVQRADLAALAEKPPPFIGEGVQIPIH